jgi:histone H3/H4
MSEPRRDLPEASCHKILKKASGMRVSKKADAAAKVAAEELLAEIGHACGKLLGVARRKTLKRKDLAYVLAESFACRGLGQLPIGASEHQQMFPKATAERLFKRTAGKGIRVDDECKGLLAHIVSHYVFHLGHKAACIAAAGSDKKEHTKTLKSRHLAAAMKLQMHH